LKRDFDELKKQAMDKEISKLMTIQRDLDDHGFFVTISVKDFGSDIDFIPLLTIRRDQSFWRDLRRKLKMRFKKTK